MAEAFHGKQNIGLKSGRNRTGGFYRAFFVIGLCFIITLCGCDRIYRFLQKEGAEELDLIGQVKPYEANEYVARVQFRLKLFGYRIGTVDGVLGANTRDAVREFQKEQGIKPSRFIDYETWNRLMVYDEYGLIVNEEINPFTVQVALKNAGYDTGKIDGKLGPRSMEMLKKFQQDEGLDPDGRIGARTLSALARYLPLPAEDESAAD